MRRSIATVLTVAACVTPLVRADPPAKSVEPKPPAADGGLAQHSSRVRGDEITPAQTKAVTAGLAWLAKHQSADGSFGGAGLGRHAGITALAGLAFMEAGNLPNRGEYGPNVARALKFVLSCCQESGLIVAEDSQSPMYGHGFATLFLGEVYGMTGDDAVKEKLQRAIKLIETTQSNVPGNDGGWRYQPVPYDADISVTICQVMALRAARDAGIFVKPSTMDRAVAYVQRCQNTDGGFSYTATMNTGSGFARSAAGVASLYYAGHFEGHDLERGLKYLKQYQPTRAGFGGVAGMETEGNYFYGNYYAVQAMFLAGGQYWADWYPAVRDQLIARQNAKDGDWAGEQTEDYCTAMALIVLQMPNRYLPVYNGKGPGD